MILVDSRGHGRSTHDQRPFGYDLMADDVVALLDTLKSTKRPSSAGAMKPSSGWTWPCVIPSG
jgi:pimeloyl-ACP methyl ester carboxylesterase